jgi:hypothetical protein
MENIIGQWLLNSPEGRKIIKKSKNTADLKNNVSEYIVKNDIIATPMGTVKDIKTIKDWEHIYKNTKFSYKDGGMIGTNVYILDKNSLMYKKSGVIVGEVGTSWLVETTERKGLVNKKKVEVIKSDKMKTGGSVADDKYVAVHVSKDGYWTIASRPTYKGMAVLFKGSEPKNETFKVVTLEEALNHKKVVGKEYLMKNGGGVGEKKNAADKKLATLMEFLKEEGYEIKDYNYIGKISQTPYLELERAPSGRNYGILVDTNTLKYYFGERRFGKTKFPSEMQYNSPKEVLLAITDFEFKNQDNMAQGGATKGFNYSIGGL